MRRAQATAASEVLAEGFVFEHPRHGSGDRSRVFGICQKCSIGPEFGHAAARGGDNRAAEGHSFEHREPECLLKRREDGGEGVSIERRNGGVRNTASDDHIGIGCAQSVFVRTGEDQLQAGSQVFDSPEGVNKTGVILERIERRDVDEVFAWPADQRPDIEIMIGQCWRSIENHPQSARTDTCEPAQRFACCLALHADKIGLPNRSAHHRAQPRPAHPAEGFGIGKELVGLDKQHGSRTDLKREVVAGSEPEIDAARVNELRQCRLFIQNTADAMARRGNYNRRQIGVLRGKRLIPLRGKQKEPPLGEHWRNTFQKVGEVRAHATDRCRT